MKKKVALTIILCLIFTLVFSLSNLVLAKGEKSKPFIRPTFTQSQVKSEIKAPYGEKKSFVKPDFKAKKEFTQEEKQKFLGKLKEDLDKKVSEGKITKEQADKIYENAQNGKFPAFKGFKKPNFKKELTEEEKQQFLSKLKDCLDKKVSEGKITQEEADKIYENAQNGKFPSFKMGKPKNFNKTKK